MKKIHNKTQKAISLTYVMLGLCLGTAGLYTRSLHASQKPVPTTPKQSTQAQSASSSAAKNLQSQIEAAYDTIMQNKQLLPTDTAGAQAALKKIESWQKLTLPLQTFAERNNFGSGLLKNTWAHYRAVDSELKTALALYYENVKMFGSKDPLIKNFAYQQSLNILKTSLETKLATASKKLATLTTQLQQEQFSGFFEKNKEVKVATKQLLLSLINKLYNVVATVTNKVIMAAQAQKTKDASMPVASETKTKASAPKIAASAPVAARRNPIVSAELQKSELPKQPTPKQIQEAETLKKRLEQENNKYSDEAWLEYKREYTGGFTMNNDRNFYNSWKDKLQHDLKFSKLDGSKQHLIPVYEDFITKLAATEKANTEAADKLKLNLDTINTQLKKSAQANKSQMWGNWGNEAQTKYDNWLQTQREKMATALNNKQEHLVKVYKAFFDSSKKSS